MLGFAICITHHARGSLPSPGSDRVWLALRCLCQVLRKLGCPWDGAADCIVSLAVSSLNFLRHCVFPLSARQAIAAADIDPDLAARLYPRQLALGAELVEQPARGLDPVIRQKKTPTPPAIWGALWFCFFFFFSRVGNLRGKSPGGGGPGCVRIHGCPRIAFRRSSRASQVVRAGAR